MADDPLYVDAQPNWLRIQRQRPQTTPQERTAQPSIVPPAAPKDEVDDPTDATPAP